MAKPDDGIEPTADVHEASAHESHSAQESSAAPGRSRWRLAYQWSIVIAASLFVAVYLYGLFDFVGRQAWFYELMQHQFAAIVGLPMAAIASICIVVLFESTVGPIKFKALGFELQGAAGPIVFWILCFLAITLAIKTVWHS